MSTVRGKIATIRPHRKIHPDSAIFQKRLSDLGTGHIKMAGLFTTVRERARSPCRQLDLDVDAVRSAAIPQMRHAFKGRVDLLHVSFP